MKKTILILSTLAVLITSCSTNNDPKSSNNTPKVLLKKAIIIQTLPSNQGTHQATYEYQYDGNKIIKMTFSDDIVGNSGVNTFTYTGDLITKVHYANTGSNPYSQAINIFYDAKNRIIEANETEGTEPLSYSFVYNTDGSVIENVSDGTFNKYYFNSSGDVLKWERHFAQSFFDTEIYTYDNANSPFKNIIGNSWYINRMFDIYYTSSMNHNVVNKNINQSNSYDYSYTYNSESYPTTCTWPGFSLQYFYE